jgi:hypothetical protein
MILMGAVLQECPYRVEGFYKLTEEEYSQLQYDIEQVPTDTQTQENLYRKFLYLLNILFAGKFTS